MGEEIRELPPPELRTWRARWSTTANAATAYLPAGELYRDFEHGVGKAKEMIELRPLSVRERHGETAPGVFIDTCLQRELIELGT